MKVPPVDIQTWKNLYQAAAAFYALQPWELFEDGEIFGVKDPVSGEIGYCCVLGALGEVFALCMYRGSEGLALHRKMQEGKIDPAIDDVFAMQNVLMSEFCDRKDLEKEDLAVIKQLEFKISKSPYAPAYPCFRNYTPGFAPWFISEEEAQWLTFALRCAADLTEAVEEDETVLEPERSGHCLIYFPRDNGASELSWTRKWHLPELPKEPTLPEMPVDELRLRKIQKRPLRRDTPWEMDVFYLPGGVIQDRDRPYYSRCVMVAHRQSGFIFHVDMLSPEQNTFSSLRRVFLEAIEKHGLFPDELHVRDELTWETLKPLAEKIGCRLRLTRNLPAIFEAKEALNQQMRRGFGGGDG